MALISKGGTCRGIAAAWLDLGSVIVIEYLINYNWTCLFGHCVEVKLILSSDLQDCNYKGPNMVTCYIYCMYF